MKASHVYEENIRLGRPRISWKKVIKMNLKSFCEYDK
jgi:hypothetical protein